MPPIDAAQVVVPLWAAVAAGASIVSSIVGIVVWALNTFERREDIRPRLSAIEQVTRKTADDVAYIRGALDLKRGP